ncbi:SRPBCC family protein [Pseudoroseicyclus tamaricis]|uniref:SRPBCC domain-containing protein n=1 Tax=Pseudoroseicyclus tamaricis TaxID=2705421 RepID=A0A6B2JTH1_9RHOB|nr:SRPBCC domain-containing protein [Pseudoroseicyclus tamaricis]NDV01568.1 SRPBCC domain-containing protein [Pseudoroseicyclus tamaricis]
MQPADNPDNALRISRTVPATPEAVFAYWTRAELVSAWFGAAHGLTATTCRMTPQVGGRWAITATGMEPLSRIHGAYHEVVPGKRLAFSYQIDEVMLMSIISITLKRTSGGTELQLLQTGFPDRVTLEQHALSWAQGMWLMDEIMVVTGGGIGPKWMCPEDRPLTELADDIRLVRRRFEDDMAAVSGRRPFFDWPDDYALRQ